MIDPSLPDRNSSDEDRFDPRGSIDADLVRLEAAEAERDEAQEAWDSVARALETGESLEGELSRRLAAAETRIQAATRAFQNIAWEAASYDNPHVTHRTGLVRVRDMALNELSKAGWTIEQQAALVNRGPAAAALEHPDPAPALCDVCANRPGEIAQDGEWICGICSAVLETAELDEEASAA